MTPPRPVIERLSTHVLDTAAGRPAAGIPVGLHAVINGAPRLVGSGVTDIDGRVGTLADGPLDPGDYRLLFDTVEYFRRVHQQVFYPRIIVEVHLDGARPHYHIPVLVSPFSYSTYLGS